MIGFDSSLAVDGNCVAGLTGHVIESAAQVDVLVEVDAGLVDRLRDESCLVLKKTPARESHSCWKLAFEVGILVEKGMLESRYPRSEKALKTRYPFNLSGCSHQFFRFSLLNPSAVSTP